MNPSRSTDGTKVKNSVFAEFIIFGVTFSKRIITERNVHNYTHFNSYIYCDGIRKIEFWIIIFENFIYFSKISKVQETWDNFIESLGSI